MEIPKIICRYKGRERMRKILVKKVKEEHGEIMLEASIILVPVIILLLVMLSIVFLFYQEAMMTSVANEIAADVAKNYKYTDLDVGSNTLNENDVNSTKMFRMSFGIGKSERKHQERAENYVDYRIPLTSLGLNPENAEVNCKIIRSGIGRVYAQVTVSQKTDFFLSGVLDLVGITDEKTLFSSTAYSECNDFLGYTSMVNFTDYASGKFSEFEAAGKLYIKTKDLAQDVQNIVDKLMGL